MRTCKLGALASAVEMLARTDDPGSAQRATPAACNAGGAVQATRRRRARLRVDGGADVKAAVNTVADPNRFAGLDDHWFWEDLLTRTELTKVAAILSARLEIDHPEAIAARFASAA